MPQYRSALGIQLATHFERVHRVQLRVYANEKLWLMVLIAADNNTSLLWIITVTGAFILLPLLKQSLRLEYSRSNTATRLKNITADLEQ